MSMTVMIMTILLIGYTCLLIVLLGWVLKGRVPREVCSKYSRELIQRTRLPFAEAWRASVEAPDLAPILRARLRTHVFGLAAMIYFYVILAYALVHTATLCARACGGS